MGSLLAVVSLAGVADALRIFGGGAVIARLAREIGFWRWKRERKKRGAVAHSTG